jgi:hypothetical protein
MGNMTTSFPFFSCKPFASPGKTSENRAIRHAGFDPASGKSMDSGSRFACPE